MQLLYASVASNAPCKKARLQVLNHQKGCLAVANDYPISMLKLLSAKPAHVPAHANPLTYVV